MNLPATSVIDGLISRLVGFLPALAGGLLLLVIGFFVGWFMKRVTVQACVMLRVDRLFKAFRWGQNLQKADVRYALFNLIGNFVFAILLFIFLDNALILWNLNVISVILEKGVVFFPNLILAAIIFISGWGISSVASRAVYTAFMKERVPLAGVASRFAKAVLILFFAGMALVQLDLAPTIVIIGFTTAFVTLGVIAVILVATTGKDVIKKLLDSVDQGE